MELKEYAVLTKDGKFWETGFISKETAKRLIKEGRSITPLSFLREWRLGNEN